MLQPRRLVSLCLHCKRRTKRSRRERKQRKAESACEREALREVGAKAKWRCPSCEGLLPTTLSLGSQGAVKTYAVHAAMCGHFDPFRESCGRHCFIERREKAGSGHLPAAGSRRPAGGQPASWHHGMLLRPSSDVIPGCHSSSLLLLTLPPCAERRCLCQMCPRGPRRAARPSGPSGSPLQGGGVAPRARLGEHSGGFWGALQRHTVSYIVQRPIAGPCPSLAAPLKARWPAC